MKQNKKAGTKRQLVKTAILAIALAELTLGLAVPVYAQGTTTPPPPANPPAANSTGPAPTAQAPALQDKPLSGAKSGAQQTIENLLCTPTEAVGSASPNAQNPFANPNAAANPAGGDLAHCINKLFRFGIALGSVAGVMFFVIAGYLYASGGEEAVTTAKGMLGSTVAGMVVLLIAFIFLKTINPDLVVFKPLQLPQFYTTPDISLCDPDNPTDISGKPAAACVTLVDGTVVKAGAAGTSVAAGGAPVPACSSGLVTLASLGIPTTKGGAQVCKDLGTKLAAAYKNRGGINWTVTATIEGGHNSGCHSPGDPKAGNCADIGIGGNPTDSKLWDQLCASLKQVGLSSIGNESNFTTANCGNAVDKTKPPYDKSSPSPSLHVNFTG